jgi:hypothetical protein
MLNPLGEDAVETRMDAQIAKSLVVRLVAGWLVLLLVSGLWQGYGAWLLGGAHGG